MENAKLQGLILGMKVIDHGLNHAIQGIKDIQIMIKVFIESLEKEACDGKALLDASDLKDSICREMFECSYSRLDDSVKQNIVNRRYQEIRLK